MSSSGPVVVVLPVENGAGARRAAASLAPPPAPGAPWRLALVANGKPNSAELLDLLAERLARRVPVAEVRRYRKPSVSVPPTAEQLDDIAAFATVALHAVGD